MQKRVSHHIIVFEFKSEKSDVIQKKRKQKVISHTLLHMDTGGGEEPWFNQDMESQHAATAGRLINT